MTLKELAKKLNYSEKTLYSNFRRTQERLEKKGILVIKNGKDDYEIVKKFEEDKK